MASGPPGTPKGLRVINGTAVLLLLNNYAWDAYIASMPGNQMQVTTLNSTGFNQWSLILDSANTGTIVGERCIGNGDNVYPLAADATSGTPSVSSGASDMLMPYYASSCRIPEGARLSVEKLF